MSYLHSNGLLGSYRQGSLHGHMKSVNLYENQFPSASLYFLNIKEKGLEFYVSVIELMAKIEHSVTESTS